VSDAKDDRLPGAGIEGWLSGCLSGGCTRHPGGASAVVGEDTFYSNAFVLDTAVYFVISMLVIVRVARRRSDA
jgi:hypothetical protein